MRQSILLRLEDEIDERFSLPPKLVEHVVRGEMLEATFGILCVVVHASLAHPLDGGSDILLESLAILLRVEGGDNLSVGHLPKAVDHGDLGCLAESDDLTTPPPSAADFLIVAPRIELMAGTSIIAVPVDNEAIVKRGGRRQCRRRRSGVLGLHILLEFIVLKSDHVVRSGTDTAYYVASAC